MIQTLLISLALTMVAYGAFPLLFAALRKKPIQQKRYMWTCLGANLPLMLAFLISSGDAFNPGPYFLWTCIFVAVGTKILKRKALLEDAKNANNAGGKNPEEDVKQG